MAAETGSGPPAGAAPARHAPALHAPALAPVETTRQWMPALQSLRGLAALWVVVYHLQVLLVLFLALPLAPVPGLRLGWLGVDLFFVLSAFLLGQPFIDGRPPRFLRHVADRFLRIAPPYYATFAATALLLALAYPEAWRPRDAWWSLLLVQNHWFDRFIAVNAAFWSLAVEMQFYLLLPLLGRLFRSRWWPAWLAASVAASFLYRGLLWRTGDPDLVHLTTFTLPAFLGHFALGLGICRIRRLDPPVGSGVRRAIFLAGLPLVTLPPLLWIPRASIHFGYESLAGAVLVRPLAACGFALVILATASGGWVARALEWRPLDWLGRISYSLYLIHFPAQLIVYELVRPEEHLWTWFALGVASSLFFGWLLYVTVEAPAERWRRRRKARQRAAAKAAAPA